MKAWDRRSLEDQVDSLPAEVPIPGDPHTARLIVFNREGVPESVYEFYVDVVESNVANPGSEIRVRGSQPEMRVPDFRECTARL